MTQVHPKFGIAMNAHQYADEWQRNADAFFSAGHYNWMSEQLGEVKKVIEIGCGSGASTEALVMQGRQVLVIESNEYCAKKARERLNFKDYATELISVEHLADLSAWNDPGVKFLVVDVLSAELEQRLPADWCDAIVCWMTGSHPEHIGTVLGKPFMQFQGSEMPTYRSKIQGRCYELGIKAMKSEGVVHIVDRGAIRSWADKDQMRLELVNAQSIIAGSRYTLSRDDCLLRKLTDGLNHSSIQFLVPVQTDFGGVLILTSAKAHLA